jgi:hypothetical protein
MRARAHLFGVQALALGPPLTRARIQQVQVVDEADALRRHQRCVELLRGYISIHICSLLFANITYEAAAAALAAGGREGLTARVLRPRGESWTVRTNRALRALGRGELPLDAFLDAFGHRASSSWELFSPRWAEAPEIALGLAAAARGAPDPSVEAAQARLEADRIELRLPDGAANPYLLQAVIIAAGLDGMRTKADPGRRYDIDMYTQGHTVKGAPKLPLNLLDALREYDRDKTLKAMMGEEFSAAFLKLKHGEWTDYTAHFSSWERDNTLDI